MFFSTKNIFHLFSSKNFTVNFWLENSATFKAIIIIGIYEIWKSVFLRSAWHSKISASREDGFYWFKKKAELNTISLPKCQTACGISACSRKVFYCYSWYCLFICALLLLSLLFSLLPDKSVFPPHYCKALAHWGSLGYLYNTVRSLHYNVKLPLR